MSFIASAFRRRKRKSAGNGPVFALTLAAVVAIELYAASGVVALGERAFMLAGHTVQAHLVEIAITLACSLLAVVVQASAAAMRHDPRPEQRRRAGGASALSLIILMIPMAYLASAFALPRQWAEHRAYVGSPAMVADQAIAADPMADTRVQAEAALRLIQASAPAKPEPSMGEWAKAAVLHVALWLVGLLALRAPPETERERNRREAREAEDRRQREEERRRRQARRNPWWPFSEIGRRERQDA